MDCVAAPLLPAVFPDEPAGLEADAVDDDDAAPVSLPGPSNESRLSRNDRTSSLCEREPAVVLADGVPGRDIVMRMNDRTSRGTSKRRASLTFSVLSIREWMNVIEDGNITAGAHLARKA